MIIIYESNNNEPTHVFLSHVFLSSIPTNVATIRQIEKVFGKRTSTKTRTLNYVRDKNDNWTDLGRKQQYDLSRTSTDPKIVISKDGKKQDMTKKLKGQER